MFRLARGSCLRPPVMFRVVVNVVMAYVGAGVLDLPFGFSRGGVWTAVFLSIVCASSVHSAAILIDCKRRLSAVRVS